MENVDEVQLDLFDVKKTDEKVKKNLAPITQQSL